MWATSGWCSVLLVLAVRGVISFNNPPGVEIWCGKAYKPHDDFFEPGGWLDEPAKFPEPRLLLHLYPRFNIYLEGETEGVLIVETQLSQYHESRPDSGDQGPASQLGNLDIKISVAGSATPFISNEEIAIEAKKSGYRFDLSQFQPRFEPYEVVLVASSASTSKVFTVNSKLSVLPARTDGGSVTKLDNVYGGLWVLSRDSHEWIPLFVAAYYVSYGGFAVEPSKLDTYLERGYNVLHPVPGAGSDPYTHEELEAMLTHADQLGLYVMYDMRHTYRDLDSMTRQVEQVKKHPSLLLWYTADEPDGAPTPLDATKIAYAKLKELDPYHPTSLVLNCQNFHYDDYTTDATDIVMTDPYPVGINADWSIVWNTPCHSMYGDCGCDNCKGYLLDVVDRVRNYQEYQTWLNQKKPIWIVPQAFGEQMYWPRLPTGREEVVLWMLGVNAGATGIMPWLYPTSSEIDGATSPLAKMLRREDVTRLLLGSEPVEVQFSNKALHISSWSREGRTLISIINTGYETMSGELEIHLPMTAKSIVEKLWGDGGWSLDADGKVLKRQTYHELSVDVLLLDD